MSLRRVSGKLDRRVVPAVAFAGALAAGTFSLWSQPPARQQQWLNWASTNLLNLRHHPLGALFTSAFLAPDYLALWLVLGLVGLAATGLALGPGRTVLLVAAAHVVGTLISEGILGYQVSTGSAPVADRSLVDVGPSYIVVCALVAAIAYARWPWRVLSAVGFAVIAPSLFSGLTSLEVSSVGHVCATVLGLGLGYPLARSAQRRACLLRPTATINAVVEGPASAGTPR